MKFKSEYTSYAIEVPNADYEAYLHFVERLPYGFDVSDYDCEAKILYIGINYSNKKEQKKLLKKLKKEINKYYKD